MPSVVRVLICCSLFLTPLVAVAQDAAVTPSGGYVELRAVPLDEPLRLDGRLDEGLYERTEPATGFVQNEPAPGRPATERTEVWVSYDAANVYVSVRAWESEPDRMIVNEMRRDSANLLQNENFAFLLDTFDDGRNGVVFQFNPAGGRMDGQVTNESQVNNDWNPVWELATGRFEGGWTAEAAVPFRSLRYRPGAAQTWGFNARRINRWKNEVSFLTATTPGLGVEGINRASQAATLTGLEAPPPARNLELKPFLVSDVTSVPAGGGLRNDLGGDVGLDMKYGVTPNLTLDVTYNTDFAQVEADEQQVNLTRFSLYFPEKREFFLENQGLFQFGGANGRGNVPFMFYSRRIGLESGREVPLLAGARLTGTVGRYGIGVINIQSEDLTDGPAATNFSVVRVQRGILRRSAIGALFTGRSVSARGTGSNELYGVDGRFAFYENLTINTYWARTRTGGLDGGDDTSYRAMINYDGDRYGFVAHRLRIGRDFNPEVGFLFRSNLSKYYTRARFSPRPASIDAIRKITYQAQVDYIEDTAGQLRTRQIEGQFSLDFENSDVLSLVYDDYREVLAEPFRIAPDVTIPVDEYQYANLATSFTLGQQRPVSGTLSLEYGTFWDGHKTTIGLSAGRIEVSPQLSVEPSFSLNRVRLPFGDFDTNLVSSRVTYTATPRMFVSGLVQYNSSSRAVSSNVRFRWEYQSGSELFIVYNETRDTERPGFPGIENRALIFKINRLFRL